MVCRSWQALACLSLPWRRQQERVDSRPNPICWAPGLCWSIADWMTFLFPWGCVAEHNYMQHLTTELVIYVLLKWKRKGIGMNINALWEDGAFFSSLLGTGAGYRREDANWSLGELTGTHFPLEWCVRGMPYPSTTVWWFRERREGRVQLPYLQTFDEISDLLLKILTTPFLRSVLLLVRGNTVWLHCSEGHVR